MPPQPSLRVLRLCSVLEPLDHVLGLPGAAHFDPIGACRTRRRNSSERAMTTNQFLYADGVDGEVGVDSTPEELVIPTQRESPDGQPAVLKGAKQKPILAPWVKDRAEFTYKMRDVGKRAAHTVGWHL